MKKFIFLIAMTGISAGVFSQPLFTYGNTAVDKDEFIRAYNKNKTPANDKEKALREYLDLYIKFKLKVKAAMELRLDTLPQLQYDAQSFRSQIQESYLNNEKAVNDLLQEAFERSQKDLQVLHFFAAVDPAVNPADSLKVYKAINTLHTALAAGKTDYDQLTTAANPVKISYGDLGYITVFTLPYEIENVIYNLKPGQACKPYRSKKGWHIFKITGERKAVGKWKVAQILFSLPPGAAETEKIKFEKRADSVYRLLMNGADFGKVALSFSDDKVSYGNNGELAEFGSGKYAPAFENEVFKLTRDNEISKPFLTPYGFHIVKRLSHSPVSADRSDMAYQFELKQKIQQDTRINNARELFVKEVLKQVNFKKTGAVSDADLFRFADSVIAKPLSETGNAAIYPISGKIIYSFDKTKLTGKDWLDFVRSYKGNLELYQGENNRALVDKFITATIIDHYKKNLEDYNADFRYQMDEFKNGNVLFEIMERNIWGKAANDTEGLKKYYSENRSKYLWGESANIILFNCANKTIADEARAALLNGSDWKKIAEMSNNNIQADSGRFELSQIPVNIQVKMAPGTISETVVNPVDGNTSFIKLVSYYAPNLQRNFDEARGLVINDYQNILEEKWINDLKKKYPVKINENVFQSLLK
ncbi:MAG: peptidylprolyl isomerase [Chitinophagaceae bacterium]|nr:peptidylprolyl isomerase [Chitinophagaceae bacterium]